MDLTHDFTVPAGLDETWAAFNHLELIASCLPGATLTSVAGQDFAGTLRVKLGSTILAYLGTGRFVERRLTGRHTVLMATGTDQRGKGTATVKITTSLSDNWDTTTVHVKTELTFTGPPAGLSSGVVKDASDRLMAQFTEGLAARFADGLGAEAVAADSSSSFASALGESAASASTTYAYNAPSPAGESDFDRLSAVVPGLAKRMAPPMVGGLALLWLVRKVRRR